MRKKSAKELIEKYNISEGEQKNIVTSIAATELKKSARLLKDFVQNQGSAKSDTDYAKIIEKLLDNHLISLREILKSQPSNKKEWEFIVKRNKSGFISKILARQIK